MTKDSGARFDFSADMRALAEKSVEQAKEVFDLFINAAQQAVNTAEHQAAGAQAGAREAAELAMEFTERNIATSFAFAQRLLQAKQPQDVIELHTEYVNSQMAALTDQAKELSKRAAKMSEPGTHH